MTLIENWEARVGAVHIWSENQDTLGYFICETATRHLNGDVEYNSF